MHIVSSTLHGHDEQESNATTKFECTGETRSFRLFSMFVLSIHIE